MKTIKNKAALFLSLILIISMIGCTEFLEEKPLSSISPEVFFKEKSQAIASVNEIYRMGVNGMYGSYIGDMTFSGTWGVFMGFMSGFFDNEYKGQFPFINEAQVVQPSTSFNQNVCRRLWTHYYQIKQANFAISGVPKTPGLTDEEKNNLLGQAKFFRGWAYFNLVRFFGDVPLVLEVYESTEGIFVERSPKDEVYKQIVEDLNFAYQNLPDALMIENGGKVTKGCAGVLLAEVYLTMSGYPLQDETKKREAYNIAKEIIDGGKYSLMQHDDNTTGSAYNKMRLPANDNSKEYIYYLEYKRGITESLYAPYSLTIAEGKVAGATGYSVTVNVFKPMESFIKLYDTINDIRGQHKQLFRIAEPHPTNPVRIPYLWFDESVHSVKPSASGKNYIGYSYPDVLLIAAEAAVGIDDAKAREYLAKVRARALMNKTEAQVITDLNSKSGQALTEEVWKERYRELIFSFKIWLDLIRTRKYPVGMAYNTDVVQFRDIIGHTNEFGGIYEEKHLLFPIPEQELQRNPKLTKNPSNE